MRELTNTEEKILDKALYLIGKTSSFNVPIRMIAKEAGVNVSAINYYFHSKEEMLRLVKEFYIDNTIEAYSVLDHNDYTEEEKVVRCANEIMEYTLKYPGIITILKEAARTQEENQTSAKIMKISNQCNERLDGYLAKVFNGDSLTLQYKRMIFLSSILHPTIHFDLESIDVSLINTKDQRLNYIKFIINQLNSNTLFKTY